MSSDFSALEDADDPKKADQGGRNDQRSLGGPVVLVLTLRLSQRGRMEGIVSGIMSCCTLMGCSVPSNLNLNGSELTP